VLVVAFQQTNAATPEDVDGRNHDHLLKSVLAVVRELQRDGNVLGFA
jgi:hypothetical protein